MGEIDEYLQLLEIFPDLDPDLLFQILTENKGNLRRSCEEILFLSSPSLYSRYHKEKEKEKKEIEIETKIEEEKEKEKGEEEGEGEGEGGEGEQRQQQQQQ